MFPCPAELFPIDMLLVPGVVRDRNRPPVPRAGGGVGTTGGRTRRTRKDEAQERGQSAGRRFSWWRYCGLQQIIVHISTLCFSELEDASSCRKQDECNPGRGRASLPEYPNLVQVSQRNGRTSVDARELDPTYSLIRRQSICRPTLSRLPACKRTIIQALLLCKPRKHTLTEVEAGLLSFSNLKADWHSRLPRLPPYRRRRTVQRIPATARPNLPSRYPRRPAPRHI
jgi:hypothetical protein